jgi:hypothetical protein
VVEIALEAQKFASREDLVNGHLLRHVTEEAAGGTGIGEGIVSSDPHRSGVGSQKGAEDSQGRGLTGSIGAQEPIETTPRNMKGKVVESLNR